jgi:hypothetical protein
MIGQFRVGEPLGMSRRDFAGTLSTIVQNVNYPPDELGEKQIV